MAAAASASTESETTPVSSKAEETRQLAVDAAYRMCTKLHEETFAAEARKGNFYADVPLSDSIKASEYIRILTKFGYKAHYMISTSTEYPVTMRVQWNKS